MQHDMYHTKHNMQSKQTNQQQSNQANNKQKLTNYISPPFDFHQK